MSVTLSAPSGFTANDLVFNDSFSGSSLNTADWNTYITSNAAQGYPWNKSANGSGVGGPYDADYDTPAEVGVNNGLTLNAVQKSVAGVNDGANQTFPISAGAVSTYGKMEIDGGYVQISMKEPGGDGQWPSLWLLPGSGAGSSGDNFEIDMQEGGYSGSGNANDVLAYHLHTSGGTVGGQVNTGVDLTAGYNTYGIDWIPGKSITWYLNGKEIAEVTSAQATIPNEPMELIMSNQVANSSTAGWHTSLDSSSPQSMPMLVNDVQVYQAPGSGDTIKGANVTATSSGSTGGGSTGGGSTGGGSTGGGSTGGGSTSGPLTLSIANKALQVTEGGGKVGLGVSVTAPSTSTSTQVLIKGLPSYETISDAADHKTFSGSWIVLSQAQANSGLTLTSNYTGSGKPTATLTVQARDEVAGTYNYTASQTMTVLDPPAATSAATGQASDVVAKLLHAPSIGASAGAGGIQVAHSDLAAAITGGFGAGFASEPQVGVHAPLGQNLAAFDGRPALH
ncbi:glycosyl hydrolase family 16 [Roseiarcus fermentans]|uniref:Glycosyl hydrolase family 16 n=1 Tax=Roseiarcus fermentans TaxID=1473586 RepID=A0A366F065_9HYPH|nr:family 16 glycosylhydrolase [Roseiarcus fermentans]RBP07119.1 glycosyl hydrolase family 16 [Roseiarcus fermentans]